MKIGETLYIIKRSEWRKWLHDNHNKKNEIWLIFYKKSSGKPRISYDDAVLEALAFGWIDSIVKSIDKDAFAQRFSPRKSSSVLSELNKVRIRELIREKKMTQAGLKDLEHVFDPEKDMQDKFTISSGILKAIKDNKDAWYNFHNFSEDYKRIRAAYIEGQKRHGISEYNKALKNFIEKTAKGQKIGFVKKRK